MQSKTRNVRQIGIQIHKGIQSDAAPMLFRFVGGKYYALKYLKLFWNVPHVEYREPFVGGGSVFFAKPKAEKNWLNDIDDELINVYKTISNFETRKKLIYKVNKETATRTRHQEIKNMSVKSQLGSAFKYFYLNRTSFSGKMRNPVWGYLPKRSVPPERWHERITPCGGKLENVKITCKDFASVINMGRVRGKPVLMYVDPPYFPNKTNQHYKNNFTEDDHLRLANILKTTGHKFFMTYDDCRTVRKMYDWAHIYDLDFVYRVENSVPNAGHRRNGNEVVITNYKVKV